MNSGKRFDFKDQEDLFLRTASEERKAKFKKGEIYITSFTLCYVTDQTDDELKNVFDAFLKTRAKADAANEQTNKFRKNLR